MVKRKALEQDVRGVESQLRSTPQRQRARFWSELRRTHQDSLALSWNVEAPLFFLLRLGSVPPGGWIEHSDSYDSFGTRAWRELHGLGITSLRAREFRPGISSQ